MSNPHSILIVEDDPAYHVVLEGMVKRWGYKTIWAKSGKEALRILEKPDAPQLAVLDWMIPDPNGVEVCRILKERLSQKIKELLKMTWEESLSADLPKYVYTIVLTAKSEIEDLVYAMEKGADDYIIKPFNAAELQARIIVGFRVVNIYNEFIKSQQILKKAATTDYLTGVLNRMSIIQRIKEEVYKCRREGGSFGIIMIDIDDFKSINDTYGHLAGDKVLVEFTKLVQSVLRRYDKLGRIGGEEFLVFLLNCGLQEAYKISERIRTLLENTYITIDKNKIKITASFGIAIWDSKNDVSVDDLLKRADYCLYEAKRKGGNLTIMNVIS